VRTKKGFIHPLVGIILLILVGVINYLFYIAIKPALKWIIIAIVGCIILYFIIKLLSRLLYKH